MPVTSPAPGASPSYMSHAASGDSSRNGEPGIEQRVDALANRQLALLAVAFEVARAAALARRGHALAQLGDERGHPGVVRRETQGSRCGYGWREPPAAVQAGLELICRPGRARGSSSMRGIIGWPA